MGELAASANHGLSPCYPNRKRSPGDLNRRKMLVHFYPRRHSHPRATQQWIFKNKTLQEDQGVIKRAEYLQLPRPQL
ncbi:putative uncharacterized protein encoded by LINC01546 [Rhinopithecus roxellana]|uniref:putative uncharacterized protein encoded by LINC01546 n=1 Tax=Rhinopithecus roxellana TaxID=61622 RepID=UPI000532FFA5|nr:putative uncharacterized protein encoded by LINC01546 [Rhinopithecus roxellana]XP_017752094.1 PREDICTED: putative uncharacterized protein encoded by LINC01546 [Rhinopithecus bieti]